MLEEKAEGYFDGLLNGNVRQQAAVAKATEQAIKRLSSVDNTDVKSIAATQIELLTRYYTLSLSQAQRSFRWALVASIVGLVFFIAAIGFVLWNAERVAVITVLSGALIEFIAGINFYLYGKTLAQLNLFQWRLEVTQRFLLANSLTESLGADLRDQTRAQLIAKLVDTTGNCQTARELAEMDQATARRPRPERRPPTPSVAREEEASPAANTIKRN